MVRKHRAAPRPRWGYGSVASGDASTAMGNGTEADSLCAVAMGNKTKALKNQALSVGNGSKTEGKSNSLAINFDGKVMIGNATSALGSVSVPSQSDLKTLIRALKDMGIIDG